MWLHVQEHPGIPQPFDILALLPQTDVPDAPPLIHLGAQFLREFRVQVRLDSTQLVAGQSCGALVIP